MSRATPFDRAVQAIITGDEPGLGALLLSHPGLVHERATVAHQATLLHYVAANGVEDELQRSPKNAPAVARILLEAVAEADALAPIYDARSYGTTLCLIVTSIHPCNQTPLHFAAHLGCAGVVDELLARGADTSIVDTQMNQTPVEWARAGGHPDLAARLERRS